LISKKTALIFALITGLFMFAMVRTATSTTPTVTTCQSFQTCNNYGAAETTFSPSECVYVNGSGFLPCTTLYIYIVQNTTWTDGQPIPQRIPGTATNVTTDACGNIEPTIVWEASLVPGSYDIVIGPNNNGIYEKSVDYLDAVSVNAGFFVIPEYVLGAIMGLAAFFAAYGVFRFSKTRKAKDFTPKNLIKKS
jgi:hypothetical protein